MEKKILKSGSLLMIDCGEYSDYSVLGFFVVLNGFDPIEEKELFLEKNPNCKEHYNFDNDKYIGFLISKGYLMEVDYNSLYLGGYGEGDLELYNKLNRNF